MYVYDRDFGPEISKYAIFSWKIGKSRRIGHCLKFSIFLCRSIGNVPMHILSKFLLKILIFEEVMSFSDFTDLQGSGFDNIVIGTFLK